MHAPKKTGTLPHPTPRILNTDEQVPQLHLTVVEGALNRIALALQELDGVCRTYGPRDPRIRELREAGTRLQMILFIGDQWITWHGAAPKGGAR